MYIRRQCTCLLLLSVLLLLGLHSSAFAEVTSCEPDDILASYEKDILKIKNNTDAERVYFDIAKTEYGLTKSLFDFAHELSNGVYYKEMEYLLDQKQLEVVLTSRNNAVMIPRLKQMVGKSYQPEVFTQNLAGSVKVLGDSLTGIAIGTNIYDALMGDDSARLKGVVETLKFQMGNLIGKIASRSLNVAMVGVNFLDYALSQFIKEQYQRYEEYWWNAYSSYLNRKYRHLVQGDDSWASLAMQGGEAVSARLEEFWTDDGLDDPITRANNYYKPPSPYQRSALAEPTFRKPFAARYYHDYLHTTLKTFFQHQAEMAIYEFEQKAAESCQKLMTTREDLLVMKDVVEQASAALASQQIQLADTVSIRLSQGEDKNSGVSVANGGKLPSRKGFVWASSSVTFPESAEPQKVKVSWTLSDADQMILSSSSEVLEGAGDTREVFTEIPVNTLAKGRYALFLRQSLLDNPKESVEARATFIVQQPVTIHDLWATDQLGSTEKKTAFAPDDIPHLYVSFDMDEKLKAVQVNFVVTNAGTHETLYSVPNEYFYSPDKESQRAGLRLPAGLVEPGETATVTVSLSPLESGSGDFAPEKRTIEFTVVSSELKIRASRVLMGDQEGRYSIEVPDGFEEPYTVLVDGDGLVINESPNKLKGTFRGSVSTRDSTHNLHFTVKDGNGNMARATKAVIIRGLDPKTIASKNRPQQVLYAAPPQRYTEPAPAPEVADEDEGEDFLKTLQQIQDTYTQQSQRLREQQERDRVERENRYKRALQAMPAPTLPSWGRKQGYQQGTQTQSTQASQTRTFAIDAGACRSSFYACMERCPQSGSRDVISACHNNCSNANTSCTRAQCPGGRLRGTGWDLTCTVSQ